VAGESWTQLKVSGAATPAADPNVIAPQQQIRITNPREKFSAQVNFIGVS
jgi:hypothetical protein